MPKYTEQYFADEKPKKKKLNDFEEVFGEQPKKTYPKVKHPPAPPLRTYDEELETHVRKAYKDLPDNESKEGLIKRKTSEYKLWKQNRAKEEDEKKKKASGYYNIKGNK